MTKDVVETPDNESEIEKDPQQLRWEALFRGAALTSTTQKLFNYVRLADQKAQGMIIVNSVIIPVAFGWVNKADFHAGAIISILTAVVSIFISIICIYPKRRTGKKPDGTRNLLHFSDIGYLKELTVAILKDIHDVSRRILRPKFFWLKLSYIIFFCGNLIAVSVILYSLIASV
jgi:hypothetical protein